MAKLKIRPVEALTFDDVLLVPQHSTLSSRSETLTASSFTKKRFIQTPITSAPMDTVTEEEMAQAMACFGGIGMYHRFCSISQQVRWIRDHLSCGFHNAVAAIGVSPDEQARAKELVDAGATAIVVDVANGDSVQSIQMIEWLKATFDHLEVIGGSVATHASFMNLVNVGADAMRVGIGGGSFCTTRMTAGVGMPLFQAVLNCAPASQEYDVPIIADGGIRNPADFAKAIAAGASTIMLGGMLVGTDESPGEKKLKEKFVDGKRDLRPSTAEWVKRGRGMASRAAQEDMGKETIYEEGISADVPYVGSLEGVLTTMMNGLRSAMSYSNARDIATFQNNAEFVKITQAGQAESRPHITERR